MWRVAPGTTVCSPPRERTRPLASGGTTLDRAEAPASCLTGCAAATRTRSCAWRGTPRCASSPPGPRTVRWRCGKSRRRARRRASARPDEPSRVDVIGPHPGEVYGCAFVGDGEGGGPMLATAGGADLRLWDLEAAVEVARVPPVRAAKDGSDFRVPADASGPAKKKTPERWEGGHLFSLSSDGGARGLLASACSDGTVKLWGLDAGARAATAVASVMTRRAATAAAVFRREPLGERGRGRESRRVRRRAVQGGSPDHAAVRRDRDCTCSWRPKRVGVGGGAHDGIASVESKARPRKERGTWRCAAEAASCAPSPAGGSERGAAVYGYSVRLSNADALLCVVRPRRHARVRGREHACDEGRA